MKFSSDTGPQVLPGGFGPEVQKPGKVDDAGGPQINGGPNGGGNVFTRPGQYGPTTRVPLPARVGFFPAATGLYGEPGVRQVDAYQGGPGGTINRFGQHRSWTWF